MDLTNIARMAGESDLAYTYRIVHLKGAIPELKSWIDVRDVLNTEFNQDYTESAYRKKVQEFDTIFEELKGGFLKDDYLKMLDQKRDALYKQQVKTGDKAREMRSHLRDEARIEIMLQAVKDAASNLQPIKIYKVKNTSALYQGEAVLLISDWHVGAKFSNFMNEYSVDIAKDRMMTLLQEVKKYCKTFKIKRLVVLNLGDMIEGNIHISVRVQSEIDAVEQTMVVGEMIATFLSALEPLVEELHYGDMLDNHGRIYSRKEEHIEKENFAKLIRWWVRERLKDSKIKYVNDIEFVDDNIGVLTLQNGKRAGFVHGHLDKINTVFQNLNGMLRETLDYIFMAHYHVAKMKEFNGGKVFVNGSLKGVDPYALNNRYTGRASQFMLVLDGANEIPIVINLN